MTVCFNAMSSSMWLGTVAALPGHRNTEAFILMSIRFIHMSCRMWLAEDVSLKNTACITTNPKRIMQDVGR